MKYEDNNRIRKVWNDNPKRYPSNWDILLFLGGITALAFFILLILRVILWMF